MKTNPHALFFTAAVFAGAIAASETPSAAQNVTLYKTPGCGCCEGYADHLRENGYAVTVKATHDLAGMSRAAGIADDFQGCHLSMIDDYVVSGHVPANIVDRLLVERPDIPGITLPGMPNGSPGMGGAKVEPFTIYEIGDGAPRVYAAE